MYAGGRFAPGLRAAVVFALWLCVPALFAQASLDALLEQHRAQPADWKLCNQIAVSYTQAQKFQEAADFFRKTIALNPNFVPARKNLGVVLWFAGRKEEAEKQLRSLLAVIPNDPVPHLYIGLASHGRGQHKEAREHFAKAGDLAAKNPEVLPAVLDSYVAAGDAGFVSQALQFAQANGDPQLTVRLAAVLAQNGMHEAVIAALEPLDHPGVEGRLLLAEAYDRRNLPDKAYAAYSRALAEHPREERVYTALAAFASAHKNNRFGLEVIEKGLQRRPNSAPLLVQQGLLQAIDGDRDTAEKSLRAAIQADTRWSVSVLALGLLQLESGSAAEAAATFERAVRDFPAEQPAYYFYGLALSRSGDAGRRQAIPILRKALAMEPDDVKTRILLGQAYLASGRTQLGIAELERAVRTDPKNAAALYQLSLAYRKAGNTALADRHMNAFRALKASAAEEQTELVQFLKIVK
jgi:tetratricopeptide (TPR) repeat protein